MSVYLIHFDKPLAHANHYIGFVENLEYDNRLATHKSGQGAKILRELNRLEIGYNIVRTWDDGDRTFERTLKNRKKSSSYCPICKANKLKRKK